MTEDPKNMTCAEFQAQLPELVGSGDDISAHPHLKSCELCRQLLSELETIAEAARQLFPVTDPPDELWTHIEQAIKIDAEKPEEALEAKTSLDSSPPDLAAEPA
jgi:hypothetical protein